MLKYHIQTIELASNAAILDFDAIPQTYDDLELHVSIRLTVNDANFRIRFNRNSSGVYNERILYGSGSSPSSFARSNADAYNYIYSNKSSETANTFSSHKLLVSNYTSSTVAKSTSIDGVSENNATAAVQYLHAGLFNSTAPVTSLQVFYNLGSGEVAQGSSASLYGIKRGADGVTNGAASGGTVATSGGYTIHTFTASGTFTANRNLNVEYLVIAGGGSGANGMGGGGGAGGYRCSVPGELSGGGAAAEPLMTIAAGTSFAVTVGAGASGAGYQSPGNYGSNSQFGPIVSIGGGGGGRYADGRPGGSGGGGGGISEPGGVAYTGQGYNGGLSFSSMWGCGGGGGAGAVGADAYLEIGGNGGNGLASSITGASVTRAGGGGGGANTGGSGGSGGGTAGSKVSSTANGTVNSGSGTGGIRDDSGGTATGTGGSGIVIIRYLTPA